MEIKTVPTTLNHLIYPIQKSNNDLASLDMLFAPKIREAAQIDVTKRVFNYDRSATN